MGRGGGRYHYGIPVRGLPNDYVHTLCANVDDVQSQESRCVNSRLDRAEESRQQTRGSRSVVSRLSRSDFGSEFEQY